MIRLIIQSGYLEIEDATLAIELLKNQQLEVTDTMVGLLRNQQEVDAKARAEAAELSKVYNVKSLANRLEISETSAYHLIRQGHLRYVCAGAKNYRVSERAVREFLGDC